MLFFPLLLAIYRTSFRYATTLLIPGTIWAHLLHDYQWDLSWGGQFWVLAMHS